MSRKVVIPRNPDESGMFSLSAFQTLRIEALDLFDRSLAEGKLEYLERFLEIQVVQEPPSLELLSQIAEDVHQRLLVLRQRQFDERDEMRLSLERQFGFDVTPFLPLDPLVYHQMNAEEVLDFTSPQLVHLSEESRAGMRQMLVDALAAATQLHEEITVAEYLHTYLTDWLMALHIVSARGAWSDEIRFQDQSQIH